MEVLYGELNKKGEAATSSYSNSLQYFILCLWLKSIGTSDQGVYFMNFPWILLNNQLYKPRPTIANIDTDKTIFYPFTVSVNKCGGSCKTIDDLYDWVCVSNKVKNMNVKVFNLISAVNETRFIAQHESCEDKCGLKRNLYHAKQKRNHDKCRC